jgi:hypothetical protein
MIHICGIKPFVSESFSTFLKLGFRVVGMTPALFTYLCLKRQLLSTIVAFLQSLCIVPSPRCLVCLSYQVVKTDKRVSCLTPFVLAHIYYRSNSYEAYDVQTA